MLPPSSTVLDRLPPVRSTKTVHKKKSVYYLQKKKTMKTKNPADIRFTASMCCFARPKALLPLYATLAQKVRTYTRLMSDAWKPIWPATKVPWQPTPADHPPFPELTNPGGQEYEPPLRSPPLLDYQGPTGQFNNRLWISTEPLSNANRLHCLP